MKGGEERPKRVIVTTELVAGADFFHHLPCEARKTTIGRIGRESELNPAHNTRKPNNASEHQSIKKKNFSFGVVMPDDILKPATHSAKRALGPHETKKVGNLCCFSVM